MRDYLRGAIPRINPGRLRHIITLQRLSGAVDTTGQQTTWADIASIRAELEPMGGKELFTGQQIVAPGTFMITVRWSPNWALAPKDRIVKGDRIFDISNVNNVEERNILLEITAIERL